jgi:hypothetical protein
VVNRSEVEREIWADELLDRLTPMMSALSVVFVLGSSVNPSPPAEPL